MGRRHCSVILAWSQQRRITDEAQGFIVHWASAPSPAKLSPYVKLEQSAQQTNKAFFYYPLKTEAMVSLITRDGILDNSRDHRPRSISTSLIKPHRHRSRLTLHSIGGHKLGQQSLRAARRGISNLYPSEGSRRVVHPMGMLERSIATKSIGWIQIMRNIGWDAIYDNNCEELLFSERFLEKECRKLCRKLQRSFYIEKLFEQDQASQRARQGL